MSLYLNGFPLTVGGGLSLNGYNIIAFGDSNVEMTYGQNKRDAGFLFNRLATEFGNIGDCINLGVSGSNIWQMSVKFSEWATDEMAAKYNSDRTIFVFHSMTNDTLDGFQNDSLSSSAPVHGIQKVRDTLAEKFPKAQFFWVIPPDADWDKWAYDINGYNRTEELATYYAQREIEPKREILLDYLKRYRFPYIDAFQHSGIKASELQDGLHITKVITDGQASWSGTTTAFYKYYAMVRSRLLECVH